MTKAELIEMVANMADDEEVVFIGSRLDRDGWRVETTEDVERVEGMNAYTKRTEAIERAKAAKMVAEIEAENARLEAEIAADNNLTKAAEKRNAERRNHIEWNNKRLAVWRA